jgi:hypothetical protein
MLYCRDGGQHLPQGAIISTLGEFNDDAISGQKGNL